MGSRGLFAVDLQTAPHFIVQNQPDFKLEQDRLIAHVRNTVALGPDHFANLNHYTLGKLTATEWRNMLFKHLDHHLRQFGV